VLELTGLREFIEVYIDTFLAKTSVRTTVTLLALWAVRQYGSFYCPSTQGDKARTFTT